MADKRPASPGADEASGALVKRQRTDEGALVVGSVTKDVSVGAAHCVTGLHAQLHHDVLTDQQHSRVAAFRSCPASLLPHSVDWSV